jgi:dTDP-4-dehydrorhamnose 3,5-epimerase
MNISTTTLKDAVLIEPKVFKDERGFFLESYSRNKFEEQGIDIAFIQDNHSLSVTPGVLRGLHFQKPPFEQWKLIRATAGRIIDVIVDIRKDSPTFGKWESFELSSTNFRMLLIPAGFAHGFCTLEPDTEVMYKVDKPYAPGHEGGIIWNDPALGIPWNIDEPVLSAKDRELPGFEDFENPF